MSFRDVTLRIANQMENNMESKLDTGVIQFFEVRGGLLLAVTIIFIIIFWGVCNRDTTRTFDSSRKPALSTIPFTFGKAPDCSLSSRLCEALLIPEC